MTPTTHEPGTVLRTEYKPEFVTALASEPRYPAKPEYPEEPRPPARVNGWFKNVRRFLAWYAYNSEHKVWERACDRIDADYRRLIDEWKYAVKVPLSADVVPSYLYKVLRTGETLIADGDGNFVRGWGGVRPALIDKGEMLVVLGAAYA